MWDNRGKKTNPKAPDFKCKDKENCDGVIWPPRNGGGGYRKTAPAPASEAKAAFRHSMNQPAANGNDNRSNRIERQHSQEMALRYIDIKQMDKVDTKTVQLLTDWFQRDIGRAPAVQATEPVADRARESDPGDIGGEPQPPDDDEPPF